MDEKEVEALIERERFCRIAFKGGRYPYMAPFQYVRKDGTLYFHFTDYGKKMRLLKGDSRVCVGIESFKPDMSEYNFVVLRGTLKVVENPGERANAIERLAEEGEENLSVNFLAAHGFEREMGWSSFRPEEPLTIVKLDSIDEVVGLKSPG
ncbi:MAG: pyridoxamine 5'-phosphate oxidase family protein [Candidatus Bathyarchaeota archaeon]|jgi:nitroimidazol reductase NimA-like FMN-containing flavoprotein (pyridoxamine 5'-phosphate oxidase superfamily)